MAHARSYDPTRKRYMWGGDDETLMVEQDADGTPGLYACGTGSECQRIHPGDEALAELLSLGAEWSDAQGRLLDAARAAHDRYKVASGEERAVLRRIISKLVQGTFGVAEEEAA